MNVEAELADIAARLHQVRQELVSRYHNLCVSEVDQARARVIVAKQAIRNHVRDHEPPKRGEEEEDYA